ncbi:Ankyrin repeat and protein kinase domain-containing protein 1 [Lasiodiplodia theobromae]|uniref:Ankyrin repeat and protein kinase domain-containing protein 1 n=1 Tax=Lasiodiplodia theobromae TaxID=45133 RepID=A0A5N5D907_9PEZI|nr:Ankyrin repeat and protein kinase domain-containing protein 1 [Lasiodiplodia theobromae]
MNAIFGGSSSSSTIGVISERKGLTRRLQWRNDNHTTLSEQLRDAVIKGQSSAVDQLCSDGADANYRIHYKSDAGGAKSTGVKSALRRAVHRPYGHGEPTLLHHAAEKGNLEVIRTLVSHGALLDARDRDARTPLHLATDSAAELLLSLGASASAQDRKASTPLHSMAARGGHSNAVAALLKSGANVNAFDRAQQTPLHLACACGARKTAAILAEAGAFVDASDADGLRPLHLAAQHGHDGIVRGLLRAGADPEAASRRGWRPIHYAAAGTNVRTVQALLAVPVDFDVPAAEGGRTPLHVAAKSGGKGVMELFLKAGAGIELADDVGNTPLISVVGSGHADVVDLLLRYEARVDVANQAGQTPLSTACSRSSSALIMVQMLLTSGARVRYEDYVSLWRNSSIPAREKKAIHAELDAVAPEELKKDEVEWLMTTL